jgi:hypothetical protein
MPLPFSMTSLRRGIVHPSKPLAVSILKVDIAARISFSTIGLVLGG